MSKVKCGCRSDLLLLNLELNFSRITCNKIFNIDLFLDDLIYNLKNI